MHLVFISTLFDPPWGGSEKLWSETALRALEAGHDVSVLVSERSQLESPLQKLADSGASLICWKPKYPPLNFLQRAVKKLCGRRLPEWEWWHGHMPQDADVICLSQGGAVCGPMRHGLTEAVFSSRIPYVILARADTGFECLNEQTRPWVKKFFERASFFVSASQSAIDLLRLYLPSPLVRARALHSPIADHGAEVASYPDHEVFRLACVGRLSVRNKGQHLLVACLARQEWRSRNVRLTFYGDGPDRSYLDELVEFHALGHVIEFRGHCPDIANIWRDAHLAVQPSLVEGSPQSLLEAMLCRRACVATAVSGISEWVEDGQTGFLAAAPTVSQLSEALERGWENRHRWKEMGEAARRACVAKRDPDPAGTLLALMREAAESGKR
jgi:L-malate glycosyltransferase